MATKSALRTLRASPTPLARTSTRPFISLGGVEAQSLSASRVLPYKASEVYALISDVDSYSSFLPYCQASRVTKWSAADADGKRWPSEANLRVGWGGFEETYTSKLLCVPGSVVEALGGSARSTIARRDVEHHAATYDLPASSNTIFTSLSTRWTVRALHYKPASGWAQTDEAVRPRVEQTEVKLDIDFQFSNLIYATLSKAVAPEVAGIMIRAFEARARQLLGGPGLAADDDRASHRQSAIGDKKLGF